MASVLQDLIDPDSKKLVWLEHDGPVTIGPFQFPAHVPVPVADQANTLARGPWLHVPYRGRGPVPAGLEGDPLDPDFSGEEAFRALTGGHITADNRDAIDLVDEIGRCLLLHASFGQEEPWHEEVEQIFANIEDGAALFDLLLRRAKGRIDEGTHYSEHGKGDESLGEFLLARILLQGAHLLSPTTPGVLYDIGVLLHDLAHRLSFENEKDSERWQVGLSNESRFYLQLSMADKEIREETPASYLLGVNREVLGQLEEAVEAYERFLASPAARLYPPMRVEVESRLSKLPRQKSE